jgi:hypothetical protein
MMLFAAVHESVVGPNATNRHVRSNGRFRGKSGPEMLEMSFSRFWHFSDVSTVSLNFRFPGESSHDHQDATCIETKLCRSRITLDFSVRVPNSAIESGGTTCRRR